MFDMQCRDFYDKGWMLKFIACEKVFIKCALDFHSAPLKYL